MRTVIAHGHIFKNAGTTFDYCLEKTFGKDFCDHRDDKPMLQHGASYLQHYLEENPHIKAISSHHMCDVSGINGIQVIPVYLLRHPIERTLSVYNFERKQDAQTPGAIAAKKYSFKDYVKWRMEPDVNPTIRNYQTIYLAGQQNRDPTEAVNDQVFNTAIRNAKTSFVGLVESFDRSMISFENRFSELGINIDLAYVKQNVTNNKTQSHNETMSSIANDLGDIMYSLINNNSYDLALYNTMSDSIMVSLDASTDKELISFNLRCNKLL